MAAASEAITRFSRPPHPGNVQAIVESSGRRDIHSLHQTNGSLNQRSRNARDKLLIAQFRFQTFKKCFYAKCHIIFVPGDFKASSPRRMFCSAECFAAHWREKLCKYSEQLTD